MGTSVTAVSGPPASINNTVQSGTSDRRAATAAPAEPAPTTTKSYSGSQLALEVTSLWTALCASQGFLSVEVLCPIATDKNEFII